MWQGMMRVLLAHRHALCAQLVMNNVLFSRRSPSCRWRKLASLALVGTALVVTGCSTSAVSTHGTTVEGRAELFSDDQ